MEPISPITPSEEQMECDTHDNVSQASTISYDKSAKIHKPGSPLLQPNQKITSTTQIRLESRNSNGKDQRKTVIPEVHVNSEVKNNRKDNVVTWPPAKNGNCEMVTRDEVMKNSEARMEVF